jgi:signal transduction histidine kinase/nitroreductase/ActR/RegA family two-component response regulator
MILRDAIEVNAPAAAIFAGSAGARAERASTEAHEAGVQRRVDARCLEHHLSVMRRSIVTLPVDILWAVLASHVGAPVAVWLPWLIARLAVFGSMALLAPRWMPLVQTDPARGLRLTGTCFAASGLLYATLMPLFYIGTDDTTKLLAMALGASYFGGVVVSASGQQRAFWAMVLPGYAIYIAGWLERGGWLGWGMVLLLLHSMPLIIVAIRQQRRSWEALVRLADDRERLAESLAAERDRAEAASASRTRFFAAASHDLRQPLHALSINTTTLDLLAKRAGDPRLVDLSQDIGRALAQSKGLLDALLDISRLDAGAVQPHPTDVDVADVLRQLHAELAGVAAQRRLAFDLNLPGTPAWAHTDADQLQRVLRNLLDNAFKFTTEGSVTLGLRRVQSGGADVLRIAVADTGCGIAAADRDKVFEEFYQVGNPTRDRTRGLGLGLAIVQRTAELLGAKVSVRGNGERGSVFELELPALPAAATMHRPAPAITRVATREEPARALSVLLVDDETDIVQALAGLMSARGWHPITATSVDAAMVIADDPTNTIDVAVIDHRLPGGDGIELIQRLRKQRPDLPALIVTGDVAVQWQVSRHSLRVLHKPLDGDVLTRAIAEEAAAAARWASRLAGFIGPNGEPPMNIIDAIHGRRSVREYLEEPVDNDVIEDLIWHASLVPRPPISDDATWAFHVITGRERLADFGARAKQYAADHQPPGAPWTWPQRGDFDVFWGAPLVVLIAARRGHPEAPFDCCRAGQNLALLAHARGLGTCWVGSPLPWLNSEEGREAVGLPEGYEVAVAMSLGHPAESTPGRSAPRPVVTWSA